jgi:surface antigen
MTPVILFFMPGSIKKQVYIVLTILAIIVSLPMMAVFALGTNTLSYLADSVASDFDSLSSQTQGLYQGALVAGDTYAWGNCTYWVYYLRQQAHDPIPTSWGNAATWASRAILDGYTVDHMPSIGSVMQTPDVDNGLGHVAYVQSVNSTTGTWTVSEMNVKGLDIVDTRSYPASAAVEFSFIHDKEVANGL